MRGGANYVIRKLIIYTLNYIVKERYRQAVDGRKILKEVGYCVPEAVVHILHGLFEASDFSLQGHAPSGLQAVVCEELIVYVCNLMAGPVQLQPHYSPVDTLVAK